VRQVGYLQEFAGVAVVAGRCQRPATTRSTTFHA